MKRNIVSALAVAVLGVAIIALIVNTVKVMPDLGSLLPAKVNASEDNKEDANSPENKEMMSSVSSAFDSGSFEQVLSLISEREYGTLPDECKNMAVNAADEMEKQAQEKVIALTKEYKYNEAKEELDKLNTAIPAGMDWKKDEYTEKLYDMCNEFSDLTEYKGDIEHIFFHPLIAYKELAFDGDYQEKGLDDYFTTIPEFKEVIKQLYEDNYVLIDIHLIYNVNEDGTVSRVPLMLPEGKKPIVISIDDLNFYPYMKEHGMAHGFIIQDGRVVTCTDRPDGTQDISDDNAIVPILEKFVKAHPDFSFGGAKGIIASTGYNGTLGFPTDDLESPDYEINCKKAKEIADLLKHDGWQFASHSYGHGWASKQTLEKLKWDNDTWIKEVEPIVGKTDIYIYPYGELIKTDDPKHQYMVNNGFKMFCGVQSKSAYLRFYDKSVLMQRRNIDGIAMRAGNLSNILDVSKILDPDRPVYSN